MTRRTIDYSQHDFFVSTHPYVRHHDDTLVSSSSDEQTVAIDAIDDSQPLDARPDPMEIDDGDHIIPSIFVPSPYVEYYHF